MHQWSLAVMQHKCDAYARLAKLFSSPALHLRLAYFLAINLIAGFPCGSLAPRSRKNRYCSARLARPRPGPRDRLYVGRDLPLVTYSAQNGAVFARSRTLLSPRNAPRSPLDESGAGPRRPGGAPGSYASALSENRKSYRTPTQIFAADRGRVFSRVPTRFTRQELHER